MSRTTATNPSAASEGPAVSDGRDRRKRNRIRSSAVGYLLLEQERESDLWEIRVQDVSRFGVGFLSSEPMEIGALCRIRIGLGPMRLAKLMRVRDCQPEENNLYRIGAEFA